MLSTARVEFFERVGIFSPDTLASLPIDMHHLPAGLRDDHLRAEIVELVPELLGLELALDVTQLVGITGGPQTLLLLVRAADVVRAAFPRGGANTPAKVVGHPVDRSVVDAAALLHVDIYLLVFLVRGLLGAFALALAVLSLLVAQKGLLRHYSRRRDDVHRRRLNTCDKRSPVYRV